MDRVNRMLAHLAPDLGATPAHGGEQPLDRSLLSFSPEVREALAVGGPVVALESTIISHGMPYPQNYETAQAVEQIVRDRGAVPATIAILDGVVRVGLSDTELRTLAQLGLKAVKTSRRDIAHVVATRANGATTVSATLLVAKMAGIRVFVTGGIGGVHRGAQQTMDVSADLTELGRSGGTAVVCAGAKKMLDIGLTLEYLETQGVTVASFGQEEFPAFYSPSSGFKAPTCLADANDAARLIDANIRVGLESGIVIGVPIPASEAAEARKVDEAIVTALAEANEQGVTGRDVTPFLLKRVTELTGGDSLRSNICLVKNNALVGATIAVQLATLMRAPAAFGQDPSGTDKHNRVVVLGGILMDMLAQASGQLLKYTSNVGEVSFGAGGVARNVAETLHRLGSNPFFVSAVGTDAVADLLIGRCADVGLSTDGILRVSGARTAVYTALYDSEGDLHSAIADISAFAHLTPQVVLAKFDEHLQNAAFVVMDGNMPAATIHAVAMFCHAHHVPVLFEPTSIASSQKILEHPDTLGCVSYMTPSFAELVAMTQRLGYRGQAMKTADGNTNLDSAQDRMKLLMRSGVRVIVTTCGASGVIVGYSDETGASHFVHIPAVPVKLANSNGAGDTLTGTFVHCVASANLDVVASAKMGVRAAALTVQSESSVSPLIGPSLLADNKASL